MGSHFEGEQDHGKDEKCPYFFVVDFDLEVFDGLEHHYVHFLFH